MVALGVILSFTSAGIVHVGFARYGRKRGWSRIISIGGGFLIACIMWILVLSIFLPLSENTAENFLYLVFFILVTAACFGVAMYREKHQKQMMDKIDSLLKYHATALAVRRQQLITTDHYGIVNDTKWQNEISHFVEHIIIPACGKMNFTTEIKTCKLIDKFSASTAVESRFDEKMSPVEYEHLVCQILKENGWDARTTKGSGDQGIDVVASRSGQRVVVQCKLYSKPVGNSAVQEAVAGREFEKAQYAAVVSNAPYTPAAKQLAASANILLLHHDELPYLESRL